MAWAAGFLAFGLIGSSYIRALLAPNSPGWDLRTAEWLRENHAGWALDLAESVWLSVHQPSGDELSGTRLSAFPPPFAVARAGVTVAVPAPAPIGTLCDEPMADEGVWHAIGSTVNGVPALRCAVFRPERERPGVVVAVARFTPQLTRFVLVPGIRDPGGQWRWHGAVPEEEHANLLAAFNAGFRLSEAHGGLYAEGRVARPLVAGAASLVIAADGAADIVEWTAERELTPDIAGVRQNLGLIVTNGVVRAGLARNAFGDGGKRAHDGPMWRSGLGIARDGALLYVAGRGLTLVSLALALQHVGAVRAMQLDIHQQWPSFNVFQPSKPGTALVATKLLQDMRHPAERYLTPDDRDFVAVMLR